LGGVCAEARGGQVQLRKASYLVGIVAALLSGAFTWIQLRRECGTNPIFDCVVRGLPTSTSDNRDPPDQSRVIVVEHKLAEPSSTPPSTSPQIEIISPSFSCQGGINSTEQTICGNARLTRLDVEMAQTFLRIAKSIRRGWRRPASRWTASVASAAQRLSVRLDLHRGTLCPAHPAVASLGG
jgi:hypothetical protein